jgi:SNF2 family DNA or RNA helicase
MTEPLTWDSLVKIKPYAHQVEAAQMMYQKAVGFANFGEMGTGKTLSAIMAANALVHRGLVRKVLIVCPVSLKHNWQSEIERHSSFPWEIHLLDGTGKKRMEKVERICKAPYNGMPQVIITNYDSVPKLCYHLQAYQPDLVISDECHAIKGARTKRTRAIKTIQSKYKFAMTGTPLPCSPLDVWSVFDWLRPGYLIRNFYAFRNRYCVVYNGAGFPMIKAYRNLDELKTKCSEYSCRKLKTECLDLPEKIF